MVIGQGQGVLQQNGAWSSETRMLHVFALVGPIGPIQPSCVLVIGNHGVPGRLCSFIVALFALTGCVAAT
eukprot:1641795-Amphidinium_carterae.2